MADNGTLAFRVLTANIQSFPRDALTLDEAEEDLRRNAATADIVLLQEIADRYQRLVERAFPQPEWEVFYGRKDNSEPIAFRRRLFRRLEARTMQLHPARPGLHGRRFTTYLRLGSEANDAQVHVTNVHLVARAFSDPPSPQRALRVKEWNEAIAKHLTFVDSLVDTGHPVLGGGDYNRQLRRHPALGTEIAGRPVRYAVDPSSIDLLWFVDGDGVRWGLRSQEVFAGRDAKNPRRNSDHGARLAAVQLSANGTAGIPFVSLGAGPVKKGHKNGHKNGHQQGPKKGQPGGGKGGSGSAKPERVWPKDPFAKTEYGVDGAKVVDWKTRAALEAVEELLGYRLTIVKGSYNSTKGPSAGTHDKGGAVDLRAFDHEHKIPALRRVGFAAWRRLPSEGPWDEHIHAVLVDHGNLSAEAASQIRDYRAHKNGLSNHAPDRTPRPDPIPVFRYPPVDRPGPKADPDDDGPESVVGARSPRKPTGSAYPPRRTLDGVDTSHHQAGKIDLRKAQHAGLRWWYLKTTEGERLVDATYRKRVREARKAGLPVGAYHFARPDGSDAIKEAEHFLKNADIRLGDMLPMLDLEAREVLSRQELTTWVGVWVTTVRRSLAGRGLVATPVIYTPFDLDNAFGCLLWVARYSDDLRAPRIPAPWKRAAIWQHSNGTVGPVRNVPGFGPVDANAMHPDLPLSALRVRRPRTRSDLDLVRRDLEVAMSRLEQALGRLPDKPER